MIDLSRESCQHVTVNYMKKKCDRSGGNKIKSLRKLLLGEENAKRNWGDTFKEPVVIMGDCD